MNRLSSLISFFLATSLITMLTIILIPAWNTYYDSQSIRTEKVGGSSLAERYLLMGDWPASSPYQPVDKLHQNFPITVWKCSNDENCNE